MFWEEAFCAVVWSEVRVAERVGWVCVWDRAMRIFGGVVILEGDFW